MTAASTATKKPKAPRGESPEARERALRRELADLQDRYRDLCEELDEERGERLAAQERARSLEGQVLKVKAECIAAQREAFDKKQGEDWLAQLVYILDAECEQDPEAFVEKVKAEGVWYPVRHGELGRPLRVAGGKPLASTG